MAKVHAVKKTSYIFQLFPKDFLKPYGLATDGIDSKLMKQRLKSFTCELTRRPAIGVSEYAQTMVENFERISNLQEIFTTERVSNYVAKVKELTELCSNLNSKSGINTKTVKSDVKALFAAVQDKRFSCMQGFMHIGPSLFLMGLHTTVLKFITRHLCWVKEEVGRKGSFSKNYKAWLSKHESEKKAMKGYVEEITTELSKSVDRKIKLRFDAGTESEVSSGDAEPRKRSKSKKKVLSSTSEATSEEDKRRKRSSSSKKKASSSSAESSTASAKPRGSTKKRKTHKSSSGSSTESSTAVKTPPKKQSTTKKKQPATKASDVVVTITNNVPTTSNPANTKDGHSQVSKAATSVPSKKSKVGKKDAAGILHFE